jgi:hypothetical protein
MALAQPSLYFGIMRSPLIPAVLLALATFPAPPAAAAVGSMGPLVVQDTTRRPPPKVEPRQEGKPRPTGTPVLRRRPPADQSPPPPPPARTPPPRRPPDN